MKYHIVSLGCPKNRVDSERYSWVLQKAGWKETPGVEEADLVILNTCAFIEPATEESLEYLQWLMEWKREKPRGRKLVLAGCLPGRYPHDGTDGLQDVDLITGPEDWKSLASWLGAEGADEALVSGSGPCRYLKVAEGCSNGCAYCTIPSIRGGFKPVPPKKILAEADLLVSQGAREIGLVAQDTGSWRMEGMDVSGLLESMASRWPHVWFRLYYLHPAHFPEGLVELINSFSNIMPYIDLPVQHAGAEVLKRMGRGYDLNRLEEIMGSIDSSRREIAVRYTVITGYPGETNDDFKTLVNFLGTSVSGRHIAGFTWYPEEGTREYRRTIERADSIPEGLAQERLAILSSVGDSLYARWDEKLPGREITVLSDDRERGHTVWDAPEVDSVTVFTRPVEPGRKIKARVVDSSGGEILAEPLGD